MLLETYDYSENLYNHNKINVRHHSEAWSPPQWSTALRRALESDAH